jgi:hypothetical protein
MLMEAIVSSWNPTRAQRKWLLNPQTKMGSLLYYILWEKRSKLEKGGT